MNNIFKKYWFWGAVIFGILPLIITGILSKAYELNLIYLIMGGILNSIGFYEVSKLFGALAYGAMYVPVIVWILIFLPFFIYASIGLGVGLVFDFLKKYKWIQISLLVLLVGYIGLSSYNFAVSRAEPKSLQDCTTSKHYATPDDCYQSLAWDKGDYAICDLIHDTGIKSSCISLVISRRGDCEKLPQSDYCYLD